MTLKGKGMIMAHKNNILAVVVILALLAVFVASCNAEAATVERDGDSVTAIRNLEIGSIVYDVEFCSQTSAAHYGDPPVFDFGTSNEAKASVEAVNAVLNAEGGVKTVGNPYCSGDPPLGPIFRVGFDVLDLNIPIPFLGVLTIRLTKVWEGATGDNPPEQGVWVRSGDWDVFPFLDDGLFAKFTVVDTTVSGNLPPSADADGPYAEAVGAAVTFNGTGSNDPDGTIVDYIWAFGDGSSGTGPTPTHAYSTAGKYNVTLTIIDNAGGTDSDGTTAEIDLGAQPPAQTVVEPDGDTATAIRNLQIGSVFYDVVFTNLSPATIYGDPPDFDFDTLSDAETAIIAVNAALNPETGIVKVGDSSETGLPIFRVGFEVEGEGALRLTAVWESVYNDVEDAWKKVTDSDVFPFFDDGSFADFTVVGRIDQ